MSDYGEKLFGLHEIKFVSADGLDVVDLPISRKLMFKERVISAESPGDDAIQSLHTVPIACDWELEHGGLPLEAYALATGRTAVETGSTPDRVNTLQATPTPFPYFQIFGKVIDDAGGDVHCHIAKAKLTESPEGTFEYGTFYAISFKGAGLFGDAGYAFQFTQHETETTLDTGSGS
jgi:hypothetical protein